MLSQRYGSREVPNFIEETEFEILKDEIKRSSNIDFSFKYDSNEIKVDIKNLVEDCFRLDENEIPKKYKLLHIDEILPEYNNVFSKIFILKLNLLLNSLTLDTCL